MPSLSLRLRLARSCGIVAGHRARLEARGVTELAGIDLNLLVALDALLTEKNVTRAGQRIGLSQSATSHALSRLRELLDDPLLIRSGQGMRLSVLGERLSSRVAPLLEQIRETLFDVGRSFDPRTTSREFVVAINDYVGATLLPDLVAELSVRAPGVNLRVRSVSRAEALRGLASGELDLTIGTFPIPDNVPREILFHDGFTCLVRRGHPRIGERLTLKRYVETPHLLISSPSEGPGIVDHRLAEKGLSRRVAIRVPFFLVAPMLVARTDYILTLATRLARRVAPLYDLQCLRPPIDIPQFPVALVWDRRSEGDPGLAWLRALARELAVADTAAR